MTEGVREGRRGEVGGGEGGREGGAGELTAPPPLLHISLSGRREGRKQKEDGGQLGRVEEEVDREK